MSKLQQTKKDIELLRAFGTNPDGLSIQQIALLLGTKEPGAYCRVWRLRKQGYRIVLDNGAYHMLDLKQITIPTHPTPINIIPMPTQTPAPSIKRARLTQTDFFKLCSKLSADRESLLSRIAGNETQEEIAHSYGITKSTFLDACAALDINTRRAPATRKVPPMLIADVLTVMHRMAEVITRLEPGFSFEEIKPYLGGGK